MPCSPKTLLAAALALSLRGTAEAHDGRGDGTGGARGTHVSHERAQRDFGTHARGFVGVQIVAGERKDGRVAGRCGGSARQSH